MEDYLNVVLIDSAYFFFIVWDEIAEMHIYYVSETVHCQLTIGAVMFALIEEKTLHESMNAKNGANDLENVGLSDSSEEDKYAKNPNWPSRISPAQYIK